MKLLLFKPFAFVASAFLAPGLLTYFVVLDMAYQQGLDEVVAREEAILSALVMGTGGVVGASAGGLSLGSLNSFMKRKKFADDSARRRQGDA